MNRPFRKVLRGNVLWLAVASLLNDAASEMVFPLLPVFVVTTLGAGPAFLGIIEGVADTTSSFVKLAGGWVSDRARRRKAFVAWGYAIATVVRPVLAVSTAPWHVLAIRFTDRVGKGVRTAPRDALLAESVEAARRGTAFGLHRAADHLGAVLGPLIATGLLLLWPGKMRLVFALAAVPGVFAVLAVAAKVREIRPGTGRRSPTADGRPSTDAAADDAGRPARSSHQPGAGAPPGSSGTGKLADDPGDATPPRTDTDRRSPITDQADPGNSAPPRTHGGRRSAVGGRAFGAYLAVLVLFTLGNASDAFLLLRAEQLGVGVALVPILWSALHVSKMGWNVVGGALADRVGPAPAIIAGWLVYAGTYAGFAFAGVPWHAWALFLVYGLFYGLTEAPEKALVARLAPSAVRGRAFGAYHFAIGIAALPASVVFGVIWQEVSVAAAFLLGGGLALVAALLLPFALRRAGA